MTKTYRETVPFAYVYLVNFFDEALVVALLPDPRRTASFGLVARALAAGPASGVRPVPLRSKPGQESTPGMLGGGFFGAHSWGHAK